MQLLYFEQLDFPISDSMGWENVVMDGHDEAVPRARAGHCSVSVSFANNSFIV